MRAKAGGKRECWTPFQTGLFQGRGCCHHFLERGCGIDFHVGGTGKERRDGVLGYKYGIER